MYLNVYATAEQYENILKICNDKIVLEHIEKPQRLTLLNAISKFKELSTRGEGCIFYIADTDETDDNIVVGLKYYNNYIAKHAIIIIPNGRNSLKQRLISLRLRGVIFESEIEKKLNVFLSDNYAPIDTSAYDIQSTILENIRAELPRLIDYPKGLTFNIGVCGRFFSGVSTVYMSLAEYLNSLMFPICLVGKHKHIDSQYDTAEDYVAGKVNISKISEDELTGRLKRIHLLVLVSNMDKDIGELYDEIPTSDYVIKVRNFARQSDCVTDEGVMYMPFLFSKKDEATAMKCWKNILEKRLKKIISEAKKA